MSNRELPVEIVEGEIALTLDMAKELATVERSEMGRQIRRYVATVDKHPGNRVN